MRFKGLKRKEYALNWDEAFPIGNGTLGGLVFGNPTEEKIVTNHEELFLPLPENADSRPYNGAKYLAETRRLLHEGKYREACEYYLMGLSEDGCPFNEIVWTDPFETAAEIRLDLDDRSFEDYEHVLDFQTAESRVSFTQKGDSVVRRSFVSRSRNILALEMRKDGLPFSGKIFLSHNPEIKHIESVKIFTEDDRIIAESTHSEEESGYLAAARVITDGVLSPIEAGFKVKKANYLLVYYALTPWKARIEAAKAVVLRTLDDLTPDYDALYKENAAIHSELFNEVKVSFSDSDEESTNEELKADCTVEDLPAELLERMTDFGRYLLICSFGKLPPNLQGVWNGSVNPPWSSDYTLDENVQMMMWQVLPGGLNSQMIAYFDWLESLIPDFKKNAASYYGCRGVFCCARTSTDGIHRHFSMDWPLIFWTAGAGWLSREYREYYDYTGDENVLLRGIEYWKEVVLFYEDFMTLNEKGRYEFAPSYSPENTPLGNDSPAAVDSTMDVAVAKEVYSNLIFACKELGVEKENLEKWEKEASLLPDHEINDDGALKEWLKKDLKDDYHHRHSSHLYPVFPGNEALKPGCEHLLQACHKAAGFRLIDGVDAISGWGLAHLANISARLKDENLWFLALNRLVRVFTLKNLFTGHNPGRLFQMDANLGLTAAVYEMFVYSGDGKLLLFPVVSEHFKKASIKGLRAKGKVLVKSLERQGDEIFASIENQGNKEVYIVAPKGFVFENGEEEHRLYAKDCAVLKARRK
jgi:hypothetical protein